MTAWSTPKTFATNETLTSADMNTYVRDNSLHLDERGIVAQQVQTTDNAHIASGDTDMVLNNVPVTAGNTYAIHLHTQVQIDTDREWSIFLKVNGASYDRFADMDGIMPRRTVDATVYWPAPTTQATDDFLVSVTEGEDGATLTLQGTATARRTLTIIDLGPI